MICKQAISTDHNVNPQEQLVILLQRLYKDFGADKVEEVFFQSALAVAASCDCYLKIEPNEHKTDSTLYFWSRSLGDEYPQDQADPAPVTVELETE